MKKLFTRVIILLLFITIHSTADDKIKVYGYSDYLPFMDGNKNEAKGLYSILIKKIFNQANIGIKFEIYNWQRALYLAKRSQGGFGLIYKSNKRLEIFDFSDPVYPENMYIYTLNDKKFKFDSFKDLKGKTIGIVKGYSYGDKFNSAVENKEIKTNSAKNDDVNFKRLLRGKIDCLVTSELLASIYIKKNNLNGKIKKIKKAVESGEVYFVFNKNMKKQKILKKFNTALSKLKENGQFQETIENFISKN